LASLHIECLDSVEAFVTKRGGGKGAKGKEKNTAAAERRGEKKKRRTRIITLSFLPFRDLGNSVSIQEKIRKTS